MRFLKYSILACAVGVGPALLIAQNSSTDKLEEARNVLRQHIQQQEGRNITSPAGSAPASSVDSDAETKARRTLDQIRRTPQPATGTQNTVAVETKTGGSLSPELEQAARSALRGMNQGGSQQMAQASGTMNESVERQARAILRESYSGRTTTAAMAATTPRTGSLPSDVERNARAVLRESYLGRPQVDPAAFAATSSTQGTSSTARIYSVDGTSAATSTSATTTTATSSTATADSGSPEILSVPESLTAQAAQPVAVQPQKADPSEVLNAADLDWQQKLNQLLALYSADRITPREYHMSRAEVMASR